MRKPKSFGEDVESVNHKHGVHSWIEEATPFKRKEYMKLRMRLLSEEFNETMTAYLESDEEEIIDGLIDICVVALGTLDIAEVDVQAAWREVISANRQKVMGVNKKRNNPHKLPDQVKPDDWEKPSHKGNHGNLKDFL